MKGIYLSEFINSRGAHIYLEKCTARELAPAGTSFMERLFCAADAWSSVVAQRFSFGKRDKVGEIKEKCSRI